MAKRRAVDASNWEKEGVREREAAMGRAGQTQLMRAIYTTHKKQ